LTSKPSRAETAEITGLGEWTVAAARSVYDDPVALKEVEGGMSISAAAQRARERKRVVVSGTEIASLWVVL
jgi:hypothetical protein